MRKTARISFFVEFDDEQPPISFENVSDSEGQLVTLNVERAVLIGTPRLDLHDRLVSSISFSEMNQVILNMAEYGGSFAQAMAEAFSHADQANTQRITEEFWNLICAYRPASSGGEW